MNEAESTSLVEREILADRLLEAPQELVFKVWTDTERLARWWGPNGFADHDAASRRPPGGEWRFVMHGPDGTDYENIVTFLEVDARAASSTGMAEATKRSPSTSTWKRISPSKARRRYSRCAWSSPPPRRAIA